MGRMLKIRDKNGKEIFKNEVDEEFYKIYFEQDGFRSQPKGDKPAVTTIRDITTKLDTYYYSQEESQRVPISVRRGRQLIKKSQVKQAIIEFLKLHPKSRNGDIWKHLLKQKKKTKVSLKMFNSYLDELVVDTTVQKEIKDRIYGDKYPRYSLTSQTRVQQIQIYLHNQWVENVDTIIAELERDVFGHNSQYGKDGTPAGILAERMYFVYSILFGLLQKQEIMLEFSARKLLTNQKTYKSHPKRIVLTEIDRLFHILDKLPAKMRKAVLDEMIVISERDYYKILGPPEQSYRLTYWLHEKGIKFQLPTWWIGTPEWESFLSKQDRKSFLERHKFTIH